jgi:hypothetical protein
MCEQQQQQQQEGLSEGELYGRALRLRQRHPLGQDEREQEKQTVELLTREQELQGKEGWTVEEEEKQEESVWRLWDGDAAGGVGVGSSGGRSDDDTVAVEGAGGQVSGYRTERGRARGARLTLQVNQRLICKLMLFFNVAGRGGDQRWPRQALLALFCVLFYLFWLGYLEPLVGSHESRRAWFRRMRFVELSRVATFAKSPPGAWNDGLALSKTFVLSLLPFWRVAPVSPLPGEAA